MKAFNRFPWCPGLSASRVLVLFFLANCANRGDYSPDIDYLGQEPPGSNAVIFAPGTISTEGMEHSAPAFSPDGKLVLWTVIPDGFSKPAYLAEMVFKNGEWTGPYRASFNDSLADDYYPAFSPNGTKLYFGSRRALPAGFPDSGDMRIWEVAREGDGWGIPLPIDSAVSKGYEFAHSITEDGEYYFSSYNDKISGETGWNIRTTAKTDGQYAVPVELPYNINSLGYEDGPFISKDGSYLIFESDRSDSMGGTDLYISFRDISGSWGPALNMGPEINSAFFERFARISPDGKYLFFGSSRGESELRKGFDIYWIETAIIAELRRKNEAFLPITQNTKNRLLPVLDSGNWQHAENLLQQWLKTYPEDREAMITYSTSLKKQGKYQQAEEFLVSRKNYLQGNLAYEMERAVLNLALNRKDIAEKILAPLLEDEQHRWTRYNSLSQSLFDVKEYEESDLFFEKAMEITQWGYGYFRNACAYAGIGEIDRAFNQLGKAITNGFTDKGHFEDNEALEILKSDMRWQEIMNRIAANNNL